LFYLYNFRIACANNNQEIQLDYSYSFQLCQSFPNLSK
jgi:hypothetical protein